MTWLSVAVPAPQAPPSVRIALPASTRLKVCWESYLSRDLSLSFARSLSLSLCMNISILFEICIAYALLSHSHISGGRTGEYTDDDRDDTKKIALPPMCTCVCIHLCMQQIYRCACTYESSQDDFTVLVFICLWVCACAYLHQGCRYDGVNLSHVYMCRIWLGPLDGMDLEISIACVRQDSAVP